MSHGPADHVLRHLRGLVTAEGGNQTDRELVERFVVARDPSAFEALVQRHGPMVLRVCQGILHEHHAAEDACQAVFLVLLRKARAIRKQRSLASWLYKVAYRVALRARDDARRRRQRELRAAEAVAPNRVEDVSWREVQVLLDEELNRLPEKYRAPLVLCCLEGRTRDEAAHHLGWSLGSVKGRLEYGRELLRRRLVRRGITLSAALGAALLSQGAPAAPLPTALAEAIVGSALAYVSGRALGVSPEALTLAQEVARTMTLSKLKIVLACLLMTGLVAAAAAAARQALVPEQGPPIPEAQAPQPDAAPPPAPAEARPHTDRYGDPLPTGALVRLGTARFRHMHTLSALSYSADGRKLLSGSWDMTARLWDTATGRELQRFPNPEGLSSLGLSPDGTVVAVGNMGKTLLLYDAITGKLIGRAAGLENSVFGLRFAPDGRTLAAVSGNVARTWDVPTLRERHRVSLPGNDIRPFAFAPDLNSFATVDGNHVLTLRDLQTGKALGKFPTGQRDLSSLAFSPDGKTLATGGGKDDRTVRVWDRATGKEIRHFGPFGGRLPALAFSANGGKLATGDQKGEIRLYDLVAAKELARCSMRQGSWIRDLVFSPDGTTLAAGGTNEKTIHFFDAATAKERHPHEGHGNELKAAAFSRDGRTLVSADEAGTVYVWNLATGSAVRHWDANAAVVSAVGFAADGRTIVVAGHDRSLRLRDAETGEEIRHFWGHRGTVNAVALSPDGRTLASGSWEDHTIRLWDVATGKERRRLTLPMPAGHNYGDVPLVFSADGRVLYSGSADRMNRSVYFWDVATGKELRHLEAPLSHLALSPDGKTLAGTGWDRQIHLWDVATGQEGAHVAADAGALGFSPDGRTLAFGGTDGIVHLLELATRQERIFFQGHQPGGDRRGTFAAGVAVLNFSPDGRTLVSGGGDTTLLLWDLWAPSRTRSGRDREQLWADLASADTAQAYRALCELVAQGDAAVPLLQERLRQATSCDARQVSRWIADLDDSHFAVRDRAAANLEGLGPEAEPFLRQALGASPSAEVRRRLQALLDRLKAGILPAETRQRVRAVESLEHIRTPQARRALVDIARGTSDARLAREASAAVARIP